MILIVLQACAWLLLRLAGALGAPGLGTWRDAGRASMAIVFAFAGAAHFAPLKHDLLAMIPPPVPREMWLIYLTGVLEIAGALGLLIPAVRRAAAICLIAFLLAVLPANIYAALNDIPLLGQPPMPLLERIPLQFFWIAVLWWTAVRRRLPRLQTANGTN